MTSVAAVLLLQQVTKTGFYAHRARDPIAHSSPYPSEENGVALSVAAFVAIMLGLFSVPLSAWMFS